MIEKAAPRWTWYTDDGLPNVDSVMAQFKFLSQSMKMIGGEVTPEKLFDLAAAKEARNASKLPILLLEARRMAAGVAIECDGVSLTYSAKSGTSIEAFATSAFALRRAG